MADYVVCMKDCTYAGQRWYPGDKMPLSYTKNGECPPHFEFPAAYKQRKEDEARARHIEEVKNRLDAIRTDDPAIKKMTQAVLNETLGKKKAKVPEKPLGENWKQNAAPPEPKVAGPQPGSLITEKRGPGRPPKGSDA